MERASKKNGGQLSDSNAPVHGAMTQVHGAEAQVHGERAQVHGVNSSRKQVKSDSKLHEQQGKEMQSEPNVEDRSCTYDTNLPQKQYSGGMQVLKTTKKKAQNEDQVHDHESQPFIDRAQVQQTTKKDALYGGPVLLPAGDIDDFTVRISVRFEGHSREKQKAVLDVPCTLKQYLKWHFILYSPLCLQQFHSHLIKNEIPAVVASDHVIHVKMKVDNDKILHDLCVAVFKTAVDELGNSMCIRNIVIKDNQFDMCLQQLRKEKQIIYVEVIINRLYIVFRTRDQKTVIELLKPLTIAKDRTINQTIVKSLLWKKLAHMIELEKSLNRIFPDLTVLLETCAGKININLDGPETAVNSAQQKLNLISDSIVSEKCQLQVTTATAIPELEVDNFLDDHLSKTGLKCVTFQKKEAIYVYGLNRDGVQKAKEEIEKLIIEKTCVISGKFKHKKDLLVSYVKQKRPGLVVLNMEDSGFLYVVGVKDYVEEAIQLVFELNEGKLNLENLLGIHTAEETGNDIAVSKINLPCSDSSIDGIVPPNDKIRKCVPSQSEGKEQNKHIIDYYTGALGKTLENIDLQRSANNAINEKKIKRDGEMQQNFENTYEETENRVKGKGPTPEETSVTNMKHFITVTNMEHFMEENDSRKEVLVQNKKEKITQTYHEGISQHDMHTINSMDQREGELEEIKEKQGNGDTLQLYKKAANDSKLKPRMDEREDTMKKCRKEQNAGIEKNSREQQFTLAKASKVDTQYIDISHPTQVQFMTKEDSRTFLSTCADEYDVTILQAIDYKIANVFEVNEDAYIVPEESIMYLVSWQGRGKKTLALTTNQNTPIGKSGSRLVNVKFKQYRGNKEFITISDAEPVTVIIRIPEWKDSGGNQEILSCLLAEFLSQSECANAKHIVLNLEACNGWPTPNFIKCIVTEVVEGIFLADMTKSACMVTLILKEQDRFRQTRDYINKRIFKYSKADRAKQNQLQVLVIPGEIAKTKADVIVNTTSRDLDLTNGKVSSTLLKAAGQGIQKECYEKYPKGISISKHEIAVTGGHKLDCDKVFHIALDRYIPTKEMNTIESIRTLVVSCLKQASEMKCNTIAFPAIGTGVLRYPVDLVAAAMFESVERFKSVYTNTSLQTVFFVIYPANTKVMEVFKKQEESLEKLPETGNQEENIPRVQVRISGQTENVELAKSCVLEKCDDELYDPSEPTQEKFWDITFQHFLLLRQVYENSHVEMNHRNDCLLICGKRKDLKRAADEIEEHLKEVRRYHSCSLSVQGVDTKAVEEKIKLVDQNEGITCVFDRINYILYIYAHVPKKLEQLRKTLMQNFDCDQDKSMRFGNEPAAHNPLDRHNKVNTGFEKRNLREFDDGHSKQLCTKSYMSNYDDVNQMKNTTERKDFERQFSWTQNTNNKKEYDVNRISVKVYESDILCVPVDCIVNPANSNLEHTGGLAFSIAKAAGNMLIRESDRIVKSYAGGHLPVAEVVKTTAGRLPYKCIFHAVGPCWYDYSPLTEQSIDKCLCQLRLTAYNCLLATDDEDLQTIAIPTISSGLFGVPKMLCAIQYANAIADFSKKRKSLKEIHIVDINHDMIEIVHYIFDLMINQNKKIEPDLTEYIKEEKAERAKCSKDAFKKTGRDKPEQKQFDDEGTEFKEKDIVWNVTYANEGSKLICKFSSNKEVQIYHDDILRLQGIEALVCSENRKGEGKGHVASSLAKTNGKNYAKEKSDLFKTEYNYGDTVFTSGGKTCFKQIIHVITPRKDVEALHMMYWNLLAKVAKENICSLALPLIGTGSGKFSHQESADVFLEEWRQFVSSHHRHPVQIHLVLFDQDTSKLVQDIFRQHIDDWIRHSNLVNKGNKHVQKEGEDGIERTEIKKNESIQECSNRTDASADVEDDCVICMDKVVNAKKLKCGHMFCKECIEGYFKVKEVCPTCGQVCGVIIGDQPDGKLDIAKIRTSCAGYDGHKTIALSYIFPPGKQGAMHPRPGAYYRDIWRTGYLPDTEEGRVICAMLKVAFERRLIFTIGTSRTTGEEGVITWNDIHHKTDLRPGTQFGYPDETYLQRVREELAVKGVTEQDVDKKLVKELTKDTFTCRFTTDTTL